MSDYSYLQDNDEDEQQEEVEELEEQELDHAAIMTLVRNYRAAAPGEAREARWRAFSDQEREALNRAGFVGPMKAPAPGEQDQAGVVSLDPKELRRMDPGARREAKAEWERATKEAEGKFASGLKSLMRGDVDVTQETLDAFAKIRDEADATADPNERSIIVQLGVQMLDSLKGADTSRVFNPAAIQRKRQYLDPLTRRPMMQEFDANGNTRTYELSRESQPEQFQSPREAPIENPEQTTVEDYLSWPHPKRMRFIRDHREHFEAIQQTVSS